ncbi:MAG: 30S ribosomal protein S4 [Gemmatimonadetes bacterium]|jgi:small subunit ribosomal protein S4|nr:30S ribosomal protein S4 [Gemmatimonadota bacterium]
MARHTGPVCRLCRREGTKLFLKGARCLTEKCAVERRAYAPGQHGQSAGRRRKSSEYSRQLREKQKVKRIYGLTERQFRNLFDRVRHETGVTGDNLLIALETRLDNIVFRMGFAPSRQAARQLVRHRHVEVNGRRVTVPSFPLRPRDEVRVAPASRELTMIQASLAALSRATPVPWIAVDTETATGRITERPARDAIPIAAQEQLIVELYSK